MRACMHKGGQRWMPQNFFEADNWPSKQSPDRRASLTWSVKNWPLSDFCNTFKTISEIANQNPEPGHVFCTMLFSKSTLKNTKVKPWDGKSKLETCWILYLKEAGMGLSSKSAGPCPSLRQECVQLEHDNVIFTWLLIGFPVSQMSQKTRQFKPGTCITVTFSKCIPANSKHILFRFAC